MNPSNLDRPSPPPYEPPEAEPTVTDARPESDGTVPRQRAKVGQTIIVPFEDISDDGPEPIRVARLSPEGSNRPPTGPLKDKTVVRSSVPSLREPRAPGQHSIWAALVAVPDWAWVAGAVVLFALASFGVMLTGLAVALYVYLA